MIAASNSWRARTSRLALFRTSIGKPWPPRMRARSRREAGQCRLDLAAGHRHLAEPGRRTAVCLRYLPANLVEHQDEQRFRLPDLRRRCFWIAQLPKPAFCKVQIANTSKSLRPATRPKLGGDWSLPPPNKPSL